MQRCQCCETLFLFFVSSVKQDSLFLDDTALKHVALIHTKSPLL